MTGQRFRSKIDWWLGLLLGVVLIVDLVFIMRLAGNGIATAVLAALLLLLPWTLLRTYYCVGDDELTVVCGPFRWRIPRAAITAVTPTRSWWSGPALSLDRLRIDYAGGRSIVVSPADKQAFLQAIGHADDG